MKAQAQANTSRRCVFAIGVAILAMLMAGLIQPVSAQRDYAGCTSYATQEAAQTTLDRTDDPVVVEILDGDGNGIACDERPDGGPAVVDPTSCGHFETREDAQAALDARPELAITLDSDGDGIACKELQTGGPVVVDPVSCGFFETQEDAQAALDENPELATTIDSDGDGIACEELHTGDQTVVVCNEALGTLVEVSQQALDQDSLDFPFHRATEAEIAAGECATVIVCNTANGKLIEVSDTESVLGGLDFPSRKATEAEIAAGTCAVSPPVTPVATPLSPGDAEDAGEVTALPTTGAGTSAEQAPQVPLMAVSLVLTLAALLLRSRTQRSRA